MTVWRMAFLLLLLCGSGVAVARGGWIWGYYNDRWRGAALCACGVLLWGAYVAIVLRMSGVL